MGNVPRPKRPGACAPRSCCCNFHFLFKKLGPALFFFFFFLPLSPPTIPNLTNPPEPLSTNRTLSAMLASLSSGSAFWSFKSSAPKPAAKTPETTPSQPLFAKYTSDDSFDDEELFPSSMELTVLGDLISQLKTKIAEEIEKSPQDSLQHSTTSQLNRSTSVRNRPRPISGLGIAGLQQSQQSTPQSPPSKRHSRSLSRSSILSADTSAAASLNSILNVSTHRSSALYPYCEVVGEHTIKLAENATHWAWCLECFNSLAEIYKSLEDNFVDKCPGAYILTTMSLLSCHMCKALETHGDESMLSAPSAAAKMEALPGSAGTVVKSHDDDDLGPTDTHSISTEGGADDLGDVTVDNINISTHALQNKQEETRSLSKKEMDKINDDLCSHILSYFSTLVTTTTALNSSTSLNLILGQCVAFTLAHTHLSQKFIKTFFEKLRVSQRLFWYPRNQPLRQWRLYWLRVVMDRVLLYQDYHNKLLQVPPLVNNAQQSPQHPNFDSLAVSLSHNLEQLNISHTRSGSVSSGTSYTSSSGINSLVTNSPSLSSTSTNTTATSLPSPKPTQQQPRHPANASAYLLPRNVNDIPNAGNLKKILAVCLDELYLGAGEETDEMLKQQTDALFGIQTQRYVRLFPLFLPFFFF